jgi:pimeloyl-ACP methyl ester carboxylesterase
MTEHLAPVNGLSIAYETFGDPADPAMLLCMGLGSQMVLWDAKFCDLLAKHGHFVIRYDNRDTGHSTKITGGPRPNPALAFLTGSARSGSYSIGDMADDAGGLLDHLGLAAAHLVGVSMGGAIAQTVAISHPTRILSLCTIAAPTGSWRRELPSLRLASRLSNAKATDRQGFVDGFVELFRAQGSPGYPFDETWTRGVAELSFDRGIDHAGVERQAVAIFTSDSRRPLLHTIDTPTLVIHGTHDRLVPRRAGRFAAAAIPGARLLEIEGMGHDLPPALWRTITDAIADNANRTTTTGQNGPGTRRH